MVSQPIITRLLCVALFLATLTSALAAERSRKLNILDRVARQGAISRNAFVPAPSCTPCRGSLLGGRYSRNTGHTAILEGAQWDSAIPKGIRDIDEPYDLQADPHGTRNLIF